MISVQRGDEDASVFKKRLKRIANVASPRRRPLSCPLWSPSWKSSGSLWSPWWRKTSAQRSRTSDRTSPGTFTSTRTSAPPASYRTLTHPRSGFTWPSLVFAETLLRPAAEEDGGSGLHPPGSVAELHTGLEVWLPGQHERRGLHPGGRVCHRSRRAGSVRALSEVLHAVWFLTPVVVCRGFCWSIARRSLATRWSPRRF